MSCAHGALISGAQYWSPPPDGEMPTRVDVATATTRETAPSRRRYAVPVVLVMYVAMAIAIAPSPSGTVKTLGSSAVPPATW